MPQARVTIGSDKVTNVLDVSLGLDVAPDANGAPVDNRPRLGRIQIVRRSDSNSDFWDWAIHPFAEDWKSGKIEFLDPQKHDQVTRTVEWKDAFICSYSEVVPDVDKKRNEPMQEIIVLSPRVVIIEGVEIPAYEAR